jgi:4-hydroxybenzoate polyprenyltransferase
MKFLNQIYQYINILSLDVVAGSLISALFFSRLLDVHPDATVFVSLALTVWVIYTVDHLRDAHNIVWPASTDRHRFHQVHFRPVVILVMVAIVVDVVVIFLLPSNVIKFGFVLGCMVLIYLVCQRYLKFLKEVFVACLYTAGIVLPSLSVADSHLLPEHYLIIVKFVITALMNLLLFSLFDLEVDRDQQQHSFVTWFGANATYYSIIMLGVVNIFTGLRLWSFDRNVAGIFIAMNAVLLMVLFLKRKLVKNNYYRMAGDAVFLIPGFYLI